MELLQILMLIASVSTLLNAIPIQDNGITEGDSSDPGAIKKRQVLFDSRSIYPPTPGPELAALWKGRAITSGVYFAGSSLPRNSNFIQQLLTFTSYSQDFMLLKRISLWAIECLTFINQYLPDPDPSLSMYPMSHEPSAISSYTNSLVSGYLSSSTSSQIPSSSGTGLLLSLVNLFLQEPETSDIPALPIPTPSVTVTNNLYALPEPETDQTKLISQPIINEIKDPSVIPPVKEIRDNAIENNIQIFPDNKQILQKPASSYDVPSASVTDELYQQNSIKLPESELELIENSMLKNRDKSGLPKIYELSAFSELPQYTQKKLFFETAHEPNGLLVEKSNGEQDIFDVINFTYENDPQFIYGNAHKVLRTTKT